MKHLVFRVARDFEAVDLLFNVTPCIFILPDNYDARDKSYLISRRLNSRFTVARVFRLHAPGVSRGVNRYVIALRRGKEKYRDRHECFITEETLRRAASQMYTCTCMRLTMHRWVKPDEDKDDKDAEDVAAFSRIYVARPIPIALVYQSNTWILCIIIGDRTSSKVSVATISFKIYLIVKIDNKILCMRREFSRKKYFKLKY